MEKVLDDNRRLIEDSTKETSTRCAVNFQTDILNEEVFRGHLEEIFNKVKFAGKIQVYTGKLLKHKLSGEYRFFILKRILMYLRRP